MGTTRYEMTEGLCPTCTLACSNDTLTRDSGRLQDDRADWCSMHLYLLAEQADLIGTVTMGSNRL